MWLWQLWPCKDVPPLGLGELVSSREWTVRTGLRPGKLAAWVV